VQAVIHPQDRSFNYGDGIFTTMQVHGGKIQLWPLHLRRLQYGAARLGFGVIDWSQLQHAAEAAKTQTEQVIKILISRGEGGRGYGTAGIKVPRVYISSSELPDYSQARQQGICLGLAKLQLAVQPLLAGIKHTNRLEQVLLKQELATTAFDDLLVLDQLGFITEASAANVFFYRDGQWHTPELKRAGVEGVMRQHIMQQHHITEVSWKADELNTIEAMFICNALMGIVPVHSVEDMALSLFPVQQLIKQVVC
jgi:4-amino-4-deoxychorismate lyase